jgi:hypothetical protein
LADFLSAKAKEKFPTTKKNPKEKITINKRIIFLLTKRLFESISQFYMIGANSARK